MKLDFSKKGQVIIYMKDYINSMFVYIPPKMHGYATTPAAKDIFDVNTCNPVYLNEEWAKVYHHITAQALDLRKFSQHDICTAVIFLCTQVQKHDEDDYKKLVCLMKYLNSTWDMSLTL